MHEISASGYQEAREHYANEMKVPCLERGFVAKNKKSPRFPGGMVAKMLRFYSSVNTLLA